MIVSHLISCNINSICFFYLDPLITVVSISRNVSSLFIRIIVKTSLSWVEKPTFGAKTVMLKKLLDSVLALLCRQELWWILPTSASCKVKIKTFCCHSRIWFWQLLEPVSPLANKVPRYLQKSVSQVLDEEIYVSYILYILSVKQYFMEGGYLKFNI